MHTVTFYSDPHNKPDRKSFLTHTIIMTPICISNSIKAVLMSGAMVIVAILLFSGNVITVHGQEISSTNNTVGGGFDNSATGEFSTVSGGFINVVGGDGSFVGGGELNVRCWWI